jgi:hypothetical protein
MRIGRVAAAAVLSCACAAVIAACGGKSSSSTSGSTAPAIVMSPPDQTVLPDAITGQVYNQTFSVSSGGTGPYTLTAAGLPSGLAFTASGSTGTISGTPTGPTSNIIEITIVDATHLSVPADYQLTVEPVGGLLTVEPAAIPSGTVNMGYNQALTVGNGTGPFTWALSGTLPPGLKLGTSTTALNSITGTPTTSGTYTFTVTASDSSSPARTGSTAYQVTIN